MTDICKPFATPINVESRKQRLQDCAKQGLFQYALPGQYGGNDSQFFDLTLAHRQLGMERHDTGLILSINAHLWGAVFPLLSYGTEAQKQAWLPILISGKVIAGHAITEPHAGSDTQALISQATIEDNHFVLNGHKRYITNTPMADLLVVYASLDSKLSAFLVLKDDEGVEFSNNPSVSSCISATMGDVILKHCKIPINRQLGKTGMGSSMIQQALELERAFIFAGISGIMQWQLTETIRYSRERKVNGFHLGKNQAISHKIADMKCRLDSIKLWVAECARLKDAKKRITLASAETKLFGGEAFLQSSLDAIHILGAVGFLPNNPIKTLVDDAMGSRLFSGSSEVQKNIIAALCGTGDGYKP